MKSLTLALVATALVGLIAASEVSAKPNEGLTLNGKSLDGLVLKGKSLDGRVTNAH